MLKFDQRVKTENWLPYTNKRVVWRREQTVLMLGCSDGGYSFFFQVR